MVSHRDDPKSAIESSVSEHKILNAEDPISIPLERKSIGGFQVIKHLASGGMGDVYLAQDADGTPIALKCFRKSAWGTGDGQDQQARFERERRLSASVSHPNIVRIVTHGDDQGVQFIAMEYVDGENLREWMKRQKNMDPRRAMKIIRSVADAVAFLHERGIVHRDLKPENILLDQAEHVKVTDFGLAASIDDIGSLTVSGQVLGSADYLAPEQRHHLPTDGRADQFSLAVISYELLTGHKPLGIFKPPSAYHHELTPSIDKVVLRGLQKDPDDRFERIKEFVDALQSAIDQPKQTALLRPLTFTAAIFLLIGVASVMMWQLSPGPIDRSTDSGSRTGKNIRIAKEPQQTKKSRPVESMNQAAESQQNWADQQGLAVTSQNSIGMKLALIPPGTFLMGLSDGDIKASIELPNHFDIELMDMLPRHPVTITRGYWIGCFEVTVGQFQRFVSESKYLTDAERGIGEATVLFETTKNRGSDWKNPGYEQTPDHPAVMLSWNDAIAFCDWLTRQENEIYRLPSEAEWEYACRAGNDGAWCFGDDIRLVSQYSFGPQELPRNQMPPPDVVGGGRRTNAFGLSDMHGNASEWCADVFESRGYPEGPVTDPLVLASGTPEPATGTRMRIVRGSGSMSRFWYRRSAVRSQRKQNHKSSLTGFRVVREIRISAK